MKPIMKGHYDKRINIYLSEICVVFMWVNTVNKKYSRVFESFWYKNNCALLRASFDKDDQSVRAKKSFPQKLRINNVETNADGATEMVAMENTN